MKALEKLNEKVDRKATTHAEAFMRKQLSQPNVKFQQPERSYNGPPRPHLFCDFHNTWGSHSTERCSVWQAQADYECTICHVKGHSYAFCPTRKNPPAPRSSLVTSSGATNGSEGN